MNVLTWAFPESLKGYDERIDKMRAIYIYCASKQYTN